MLNVLGTVITYDNVVLRTFMLLKYSWVSVMMCTTYFHMIQGEKKYVYREKERECHNMLTADISM